MVVEQARPHLENLRQRATGVKLADPGRRVENSATHETDRSGRGLQSS